MSDYMSVATPQKTFNQSSAFAVAVQRAKQVSAKINPGAVPNDRQVKRPLEDALEPDAKKVAGSVINNTAAAVVPPQVAAQVPSRPPPPAQANIVSAPPGLGVPPTLGGLSGPQFNDYIKVPDKMVGLIRNHKMEDEECAKMFEHLQQYVPHLEKVIAQLKDPKKEKRELQLNKLEGLYSMITDKKKKLKLDTLRKCENVILKILQKVNPMIARELKAFISSPASTSPPKEHIPLVDLTIVTPTKKIKSPPDPHLFSIDNNWISPLTRKETIFAPVDSPNYKTEKPDIYNKSAATLNSSPKRSVFDRLGPKVDMSKPPLSEEDLQQLTTPHREVYYECLQDSILADSKTASNEKSSSSKALSSDDDIYKGDPVIKKPEEEKPAASNETEVTELSRIDPKLITEFVAPMNQSSDKQKLLSALLSSIEGTIYDDQKKEAIKRIKNANNYDAVDNEGGSNRAEIDTPNDDKDVPSTTEESTKVIEEETKTSKVDLVSSDLGNDDVEDQDQDKIKPKKIIKWLMNTKSAKKMKKRASKKIEDLNSSFEENVVETVRERTKSKRRIVKTVDGKPRKCRTELDMLHEDINEMFIRDGVLTANGKRMCTMLKKDSEVAPIKDKHLSKVAESEDTPSDFSKRRARQSDPKVLFEKTDLTKHASWNRCMRTGSSLKNKLPKRNTRSKINYKEDTSDDENKDESKAEDETSTMHNKRRGNNWALGIIHKRPKRKATSRPATPHLEDKQPPPYPSADNNTSNGPAIEIVLPILSSIKGSSPVPAVGKPASPPRTPVFTVTSTQKVIAKKTPDATSPTNVIKLSGKETITLYKAPSPNPGDEPVLPKSPIVLNGLIAQRKGISSLNNIKVANETPDPETIRNFINIHDFSNETTMGVTFGPDQIDKLPIRPIFSKNIVCARCGYESKVRTNLVRHLQFHLQDKEVPACAPVNPVPCLDNNEKMFDKMTNLAHSSFSDKSRMSAPLKKETSCISKEEEANYPRFVHSAKRYVCGFQNCQYLNQEESILRNHVQTFHSDETSYKCLHCNESLTIDNQVINVENILHHLKLHDLNLYKCKYCTFLHYQKQKVEVHVTEKHLNDRLHIVVVREMEQEPQDLPLVEEVKEKKPWRCGISKYRCTTKSEIVSHAFNKHEVENRYNCAMCNFKSNERDTFESHFRVNHLGHRNDVNSTYYEVTDAPQAVKPVETEIFDTTPLWKRDKNKFKHIRGIPLDDSIKEPKKSPFKAVPMLDNLDKSIEAIANGSATTAPRNSKSGVIKIPKTMKEKRMMEDSARAELLDNDLSIVIDDVNDTVTERYYDDPVTIIYNGTETSKQLTVKDIEKMDLNVIKFGEFSCVTGKFGKPANKEYFCPICKNFKTKWVMEFTQHLYKDLKYDRFVCTRCGLPNKNSKVLERHSIKQHPNEALSIRALPADKRIEDYVNKLLAYQQRVMLPSSQPEIVERKLEPNAYGEFKNPEKYEICAFDGVTSSEVIQHSRQLPENPVIIPISRKRPYTTKMDSDVSSGALEFNDNSTNVPCNAKPLALKRNLPSSTEVNGEAVEPSPPPVKKFKATARKSTTKQNIMNKTTAVEERYSYY